MGAWEELKNTIIKEQIKVTDGIIVDISKSIGNYKTPRDYWTKPLEEWANEQIQPNNIFKLTVQEYAKLKKLITDLQESFHWHCGEEADLINDFRDEFNLAYKSILESKEVDLKIEAAALLIEHSKFDYAPLANWYLTTWHLPPEKFNEAMGNFWGDVWRHAAGGAALGATAAGVPTGGSAALPGGLIGGTAGGLYGGGKNVLQRIWNWRQSQSNFEQTQKQALDNLKKLKGLAHGFDLNPNFVQFLDTVIDELGKVKAYRLKPPGIYRPSEPAKPITMPQKPEELPTSSPMPTAEPAKATPDPEAVKQAEERLRKEKEVQARLQAEKERKEREAHLKIETPEDILRIYKKAKADNDVDTLGRLSVAVNASGGDIAVLKDLFANFLEDPHYDYEQMKTQTEEHIKDAEPFFKKLEDKIRMQQLAATGEPQPSPESPTPKVQEPLNPESLFNLSKGKLIKLLEKHKINYQMFWEKGIPNAGTSGRASFMERLKEYMAKKESVVGKLVEMLREGKTLPVKHNVDSMPINERVKYFKSLLHS